MDFKKMWTPSQMTIQTTIKRVRGKCQRIWDYGLGLADITMSLAAAIIDDITRESNERKWAECRRISEDEPSKNQVHTISTIEQGLS